MGLSNAELGRRVEVTGEAIRQYREGLSLPKGDKVPAMARALGVSQEDLLSLIQGQMPSVETNGILDNAAIIVRHAKTKKVWVTFEITCRVHVHDPIDLEGGEPPTGDPDIDEVEGGYT